MSDFYAEENEARMADTLDVALSVIKRTLTFVPDATRRRWYKAAREGRNALPWEGEWTDDQLEVIAMAIAAAVPDTEDQT